MKRDKNIEFAKTAKQQLSEKLAKVSTEFNPGHGSINNNSNLLTKSNTI